MVHNYCVPSLGCLTSHFVHTTAQTERLSSLKVVYIITLRHWYLQQVGQVSQKPLQKLCQSVFIVFMPTSSAPLPTVPQQRMACLLNCSKGHHTHAWGGGGWGGYVYICLCACTSPHSIISHPHIGQSEATSSSICALTFACPLVPSDRWLWYWTTRLSRCRLHMYTSWRRRRKC